MRSRFSIPQQPEAIYSRLGASIGLLLVVTGLWFRHQPADNRSMSRSPLREQAKSLTDSRRAKERTRPNPNRSETTARSSLQPNRSQNNVSPTEAFHTYAKDDRTILLTKDIKLEVRNERIFIDAEIPMNKLRPGTKSTLPVRIEGELILRGERPIRRVYLEPTKINGITPPSFMMEKVRRTNLYPLLSANRNFVRFIHEWDQL